MSENKSKYNENVDVFDTNKSMFKWGTGILIVIFLLTIVGVLLFGPLNYLINPIQGALEKQRIVTAGGNQIASDNFFHQRYNDVIALAHSIDATQVQVNDFKVEHNNNLGNLSSTDSTLYNALKSQLTGQISGLNSMVAEYNAKAASDQTSPYLTNLPKSLPTDLNTIKNLPPM